MDDHFEVSEEMRGTAQAFLNVEPINPAQLYGSKPKTKTKPKTQAKPKAKAKPKATAKEAQSSLF